MSDPIRNLTLSLLVLSAAPALARAQTPVDTVITVQPGGRLEVENFQGSVTVDTTYVHAPFVAGIRDRFGQQQRAMGPWPDLGKCRDRVPEVQHGGIDAPADRCVSCCRSCFAVMGTTC